MTAPARRETLLLVLTLTATALLYLPNVLSPRIFGDDFDILGNSWDWPTTYDKLWFPHNEHAMPLGRLLAWLQVALTPGMSALPYVFALQGPLAAVLATFLIYLFVRREFGRPFPALLAAVLYGLSLKYEETVTWYAASYWLLGFDTMLLALLMAQAWRQTGKMFYLALTVLVCALAPCWYAGGILAGPLCVLYLLPQTSSAVGGWRGRFLACIPVLGSVLFLLVSLPQNADKIMHTGHYGDKTAIQVFNPLFGLACTGRAIVDVLFLNPTGLGGRTCPPILVPFVLAALIGVGVWWNWRASIRIVLLSLGLILSHYVMTFSSRSLWSYEGQMVTWTRYHMVPWFGMVLLIVNGLVPRTAAKPADVPLTSRQSWGLGIAIAVLFGLQLPVNYFVWDYWSEANRAQREMWGRLDEVEAACRANGISADAAKAELKPLDDPLGRGSAWVWLRGSDDPKELPPDEVRRRLPADLLNDR